MKDSSFIKEVVWENDTLFVRLKSGRFYEYENVPESVYQDFINADSLGKFFGDESVEAAKASVTDPARWPFPTSAKP